MIVLDEQLNYELIELDIARWYKGTVVNIQRLRPRTIILDDAIDTLLRRTKQATFVTINYKDFWNVLPASRDYCAVCIRLPTERALEVPGVLARGATLTSIQH